MKGDDESQSFPKSLRLLRRAEYRRVYDEGRRRSASVCTIFYRANGLARTRLGITTTKALGNAVTRNRIRRRLREVFRLHRAAIPAGWDVVLNPRPSAATMPFLKLERELLQLFPRAQASPPMEPSSGADAQRPA